jgi:hypothetical protein
VFPYIGAFHDCECSDGIDPNWLTGEAFAKGFIPPLIGLCCECDGPDEEYACPAEVGCEV